MAETASANTERTCRSVLSWNSFLVDQWCSTYLHPLVLAQLRPPCSGWKCVPRRGWMAQSRGAGTQQCTQSEYQYHVCICDSELSSTGGTWFLTLRHKRGCDFVRENLDHLFKFWLVLILHMYTYIYLYANVIFLLYLTCSLSVKHH